MTMMEEHIEGISYSEEVKNAVRYGYQYRKEAEKGDLSLKHCMPDASDVLLWLGSAILSGMVYDKVKELAKKAWTRLKDCGKKADMETEAVLENEAELKMFYEYVLEFSEHRMSITDEQRKYIKEEIFCDYGAAKETEIYSKKGRMATFEERKIIFRESMEYAEKLTRIKSL